MAIACSTSAFRVPLDEALRQVAELGFNYVDLITIPGWDHIQPDALAEDLEATAERVEMLLRKHDLTAVAMNVGIPATYDRSAEASAARLAQVRGVAGLMQRLAIGVASFYPGYKVEDRPWKEVLAASAETFEEMLEIADDAGVTFAVELHYGTPYQTLGQCAGLLDAVPGLGVAYDPSHFAMQCVALGETGFILDRTVHVHLRDAAPDQMFVPLGEGTVDVDWIVESLLERGYDGHFSMEYLKLHDGARRELIRLRNMVAAHLGE